MMRGWRGFCFREGVLPSRLFSSGQIFMKPVNLGRPAHARREVLSALRVSPGRAQQFIDWRDSGMQRTNARRSIIMPSGFRKKRT
jgi:hypothetical protein